MKTTIKVLIFDETKATFNYPVAHIIELLEEISKEEIIQLGLTEKDINNLNFKTGAIINALLFYKATIYMLMYKNKCIGIALTKPNDFYSNCRTFCNLYIIPEHRNKGLGSKFTEEIFRLEKLNWKGLKKIYLTARNERLVNWYSKMGFVPRYTEMTLDI